MFYVGTLSVLSPTFFVALGLLTVRFVLALRRSLVGWVPALDVTASILLLQANTVVVESVFRQNTGASPRELNRAGEEHPDQDKGDRYRNQAVRLAPCPVMENATEPTNSDGAHGIRRPTVDRVVFVSDLHLSRHGFGGPARVPNELKPAQAFVGFIEHLCNDMRREHSRSRLVLLGDTLELLDPRLARAPAAVPNVATRLRAIAEANRAVLDALKHAIVMGWELHVVPGNHDMEFSFPHVQALFTEAVLGQLGSSNVIAFDPWIFLVPGTFYAEHGHQYHDLNAFRSVLVPSVYDDPERLDHPIGAYFDAALRDEATKHRRVSMRSPFARARTWRALVRGAVAYARATVSNRDADDAHRAACGAALQRYAEESPLNLHSLIAIDAASRRGVGAFAARATRYGVAEVMEQLRSVRERRARTKGNTLVYLPEAARAIDSILGICGKVVPFYVFGHSHVAERVPLRAGQLETPWMLGTGTWTTEGPRGADLPSRRSRYPWVEITRRGDQVSAHVRTWDARAGRVEVLA